MTIDPKPRILYVADAPEWSFDRKGQDYRKHLPDLDIDIGFANPVCFERGLGHAYYRDMEKTKHYDAVWHLHDGYIWSEEELAQYIEGHHRNNTLVFLTINQFYNSEEIELRRTRLERYDGISVNNPYCYFILKDAGFDVTYTPDGYPGETFMPEVAIENRPFNVVFVSSKLWLQHKGYEIWCKVRDTLEQEGIGFIEVVADSMNNTRSFEQMNEIYNRAQVFVCMSKSEGGPCTLQETAAAGLVPVCTRVGYTEYLKNIFIVERKPEPFIEKIRYLRDNPVIVKQMSRAIVKEAYHWQSCFAAQHWGDFAQNHILRHRGLRLA